MAFSPDGSAMIHLTSNWIHRAVVPGDSLVNLQLASRRTGDLVSNPRFLYWIEDVIYRIGYPFYDSPPAFHIMDARAEQVQFAWFPNSFSVAADTVNFAQPGYPPIATPTDSLKILLEQWQQKLALTLNETSGKIEPTYLPPQTRPQEQEFPVRP